MVSYRVVNIILFLISFLKHCRPYQLLLLEMSNPASVYGFIIHNMTEWVTFLIKEINESTSWELNGTDHISQCIWGTVLDTSSSGLIRKQCFLMS